MDAAEIARGLTEGERDQLLNATCSVPLSHPEWSADCICGGNDGATLYAKGLAYIRERWPGGMVRTPLGEAVRAILQEQQS